MRDHEYPKHLEFTELIELHNGYAIHWAVSRSDVHPEKWIGHFRAIKEATATIRGSIIDLQDSEAAAQNRAIDDAKFFVDEALVDQGRATLDHWENGDYRVYGYAVPAAGGGFHPAYVVDRARGIPDAPRIAVKFRVVTSQVCEFEGIAKVMALSHGDQRVNSGQDLLF